MKEEKGVLTRSSSTVLGWGLVKGNRDFFFLCFTCVILSVVFTSRGLFLFRSDYKIFLYFEK